MVMHVVVSNLLWFLVFGATALGLSFVSRLSRRSRTALRWAGVLLLFVFALGVFETIYGTPGREVTVPEVRDVAPAVKPGEDVLSILALPWDSKKQANWQIAKITAHASAIAYLPPNEAKPKFKALGFEDVGYFDDESMAGYVITAGDFAVVAFRGSDDIPDFVENLKTLSIKTPRGRVHRGFYGSYLRLKPKVRSLLMSSRTRSVWVTGHSLGGALAVLCADDLLDSDVDVLGLITFGQPLVARRSFAEHIDSVLASRFAHFVNESDIITRIAPSYTYCGSLVWFVDGGVHRSAHRARLMGSADDEQPELETDEGDLEPLSQDEFRELKERAREENAEPPVGPDNMPLVMGTSPLFDDHAMSLYLEKVQSLVSGDGDEKL